MYENVEGAIKEYEILFFLTCFVLISQTDDFYYLYCHQKNCTVCKRYFAINFDRIWAARNVSETALWTLNCYDFHIIFNVISKSSMDGDSPDP